MKINEVGEYIQEYSRLLYWIYFKPYTFAKWLQDIHPILNPDTNPFSLRAEFRQNPQLRRYANQVWWLTAIVPILALLIVAPIYSLFADRSFNWQPSGLFIFGWIGGIWPARIGSDKWISRLAYLLYGAMFLWNISYFILPISAQQLIQHTFAPLIPNSSFLLIFIPVSIGMMFGVAFGVAGGIAIGVAGGMAMGMAMGMAIGLAGSVAGGLVVGGVAAGLVVGDAALSLAFGVATILSMLRVYFWIPESIVRTDL